MAMSQAMSVLTSRATVDWYTPPEIIEMARAVLGSIDLDPASDALPQTWIRAKEYRSFDLTGFVIDPSWNESQYKRELRRYSRQQLDQQSPWKGNVWLNSPFDDTGYWTKRMKHDFGLGGMNAIQLVNSNLGYEWYEDLWNDFPVACLRKRIRFIKADGTQGGQAKRGQTFVYFGKNVEKFAEVFRTIGRIILPEILMICKKE